MTFRLLAAMPGAVLLAACSQVHVSTLVPMSPGGALSTGETSTVEGALYTPNVRSSEPLPTEKGTPQPIESPTLTNHQVVATLSAVESPTPLGRLPSPDGRWSADVLAYPCAPAGAEQQYAYDQLFITSRSDARRRQVDYQLQNCGGLGAYGLAAVFWSVDSRFLYYTEARQGFPDGCGYWERPLSRLDLYDWSVIDLGAGPISPDMAKMATWLGRQLTIWKLTGGPLVVTAQIDQGRIPGPIAWSPDSRSIAYLLSSDYCPLGRTYVMRLDLGAAEPVLLLAADSPSFAGIQWNEQVAIVLTDEQGAQWRYNLIEAQLRPPAR